MAVYNMQIDVDDAWQRSYSGAVERWVTGLPKYVVMVEMKCHLGLRQTNREPPCSAQLQVFLGMEQTPIIGVG